MPTAARRRAAARRPVKGRGAAPIRLGPHGGKEGESRYKTTRAAQLHMSRPRHRDATADEAIVASRIQVHAPAVRQSDSLKYMTATALNIRCPLNSEACGILTSFRHDTIFSSQVQFR
jgi:hypothetical protein